MSLLNDDAFLVNRDGTDFKIKAQNLATGLADYITGAVVSDTAPSGKKNGDLWWHSVSGQGFIYYVDGTSAQWVAFTPQLSGNFLSLDSTAGAQIVQSRDVTEFKGLTEHKGGIKANRVTAYGETNSLVFQTNSPNGNYSFNTSDGSTKGNLRFNNITSQRNFDFPDIAGTISVLDSNGSATFDEVKVNNLTLDDNVIESSGALSLTAGGTGGITFKTSNNEGNYNFRNLTETATGILRFNEITQNRSYEFPDTTGTVCVLDSNGSATFDEVKVNNLTLDGNLLSSSGSLNFEANGTGSIQFKTKNQYSFYNLAETFAGRFKFEELTANKSYEFPDNNGTVCVLDSNGSATFDEVKVNNLTLDGNVLSCSGNLTLEAGGSGAVSFKTKNSLGNYIFYNLAETFSGRLQFEDITANRSYNFPDDSGTIALTTTNSFSTTDKFSWNMSGTERMTIDSSGRLNVMSTASVQARFGSIDGTTEFNDAENYIMIYGNDSDNYTKIKGCNAAGSSLAFNVQVGGSNRMTVRSDGDILNINGNYGTISDQTLKENISDASSQWDDVKAVKVRNFNFKEETGYSTEKQIGWVAQEVELISPGCVSQASISDSENDTKESPVKGIKTSIMFIKAYKALQEAMARIELLEAKIQQLEGS